MKWNDMIRHLLSVIPTQKGESCASKTASFRRKLRSRLERSVIPTQVGIQMASQYERRCRLDSGWSLPRAPTRGRNDAISSVFLFLVTLFFLSLSPALAQTTATANEKQIGVACANGAASADFDTLAQCSATSGAGTMQKAPLFAGAVTSPPYSATTCDSTKAGMIQYTASNAFQVCNGTTWSTLGTGGGSGVTCDSSTVLLMHMDGSNGSTAFEDSSLYSASFTSYGPTQSTAQYKFGTASGYFDGTSYISTPDSATLSFGTENFTIDLWVKRATFGTYQAPISQAINGSGPNMVFNLNFWNDNLPTFYVYPIGYIWGTTAITDTNWHHYALVRNGSTFTFYVDGVAQNSATSASAVNDVSTPLLIGRYVTSATGWEFNGYIDEVRISKGVARWTSNFSPPTSAYVSCSNGVTCASISAGSQLFTSSGTFTPPSGITSSCPLTVRVAMIGGGGGGCSGGQGGGGSGYVTAISTPLTSSSALSVTVGSGGAGINNASWAGAGTSSTFGYFTAAGGSGSQNGTGGNGGSGGGALGYSAAGGTGGTSGANGQGPMYGTYPPGSGQGTFITGTNTVQGVTFTSATITAGSGGAGTASSGHYTAGGGGGGILINGAGTGGTNGAGSLGGGGGAGYGGGGGGGSYDYAYGGNGAAGAVYVEWSGRDATTGESSSGTCPTFSHGSSIFSSSGSFIPLAGVSTACPLPVKVLLVGGGGGGGGRAATFDGGGGGSGYVSVASFNITSEEPQAVVVGTGGAGGTTDSSMAGGAGTVSSFASRTATGGSGGTGSAGGAGGSGGGGYSSSSPGGTGGTNGSSGTQTGGGTGQGASIVTSTTTVLGQTFQFVTASAGSGGSGSGSCVGGYSGGGGGGIKIQGGGPTAESPAASGGAGYGAGGGAGCDTNGGAGASGVVYVEW